MRDYEKETNDRVAWIQSILKESGAKGIIYGNSGGKDSVLVGALCRKATDNLLGVIMPCGSKANYGSDREHGIKAAERFGINTITVDLTAAKETITRCIADASPQSYELSPMAQNNINPRLRMTTLYSLAQSLGYLVAGTGNRSEVYMGYFTKWGDGAFDFNPISDLTVTEIFEFLRYLDAPVEVIEKAPSAGLFDGQTDEKEMGVTYASIDQYIITGDADPNAKEKINRAHQATEHKRRPARLYN